MVASSPRTGRKAGLARIDEFDRLDADEAARLLTLCADVPWWSQRIVDARPFASRKALLQAAGDAAQGWRDADVDGALAHHPRIGEPPADAPLGAPSSAREQAAVAVATVTVQEAIAEGNARYEDRFGRIFLIRAAGRTPEEILAALIARLDNDDAAERRVVATELRDIALRRLGEVVDA